MRPLFALLLSTFDPFCARFTLLLALFSKKIATTPKTRNSLEKHGESRQFWGTFRVKTGTNRAQTRANHPKKRKNSEKTGKNRQKLAKLGTFRVKMGQNAPKHPINQFFSSSPLTLPLFFGFSFFYPSHLTPFPLRLCAYFSILFFAFLQSIIYSL